MISVRRGEKCRRPEILFQLPARQIVIGHLRHIPAHLRSDIIGHGKRSSQHLKSIQPEAPALVLHTDSAESQALRQMRKVYKRRLLILRKCAVKSPRFVHLFRGHQ